MTGKTFDIGESIFFFFKRAGANPLGALWIAACQALVVAAIAAAAFMLLGPFYIGLFDLVANEAAGSMSEEEMGREVLGLIGPVFAFIPLIGLSGIAAALMFQGAWLRFLTRGEIAAVIPFRLGGDEFRLLGVNLLYIAVGTAAYIGIVIAIIVVSLLGAAMVAGSDGSMTGGLLTGLVVFIGVIAVIGIVLVFCIRMAMAPALTILDRRVRFFESWSASEGVFWNLALSYLVVFGLSLVLSMVLGTVIQMIFLGALLPLAMDFAALAEGTSQVAPEEVIAMLRGTFSEPGVAIALITGMVLAYLMQITFEGMWHGVGAYNAVRYRGDGADDNSDAPVLAADHPAGASPSED